MVLIHHIVKAKFMPRSLVQYIVFYTFQHESCFLSRAQKMLSVILITSSFRLRPPMSPPLQSSFKNVMDIDKRKNIIFTACMHVKLSYKNIHLKKKNFITRFFSTKYLPKVLVTFKDCYSYSSHWQIKNHIGTPTPQETLTKW